MQVLTKVDFDLKQELDVCTCIRVLEFCDGFY